MSHQPPWPQIPPVDPRWRKRARLRIQALAMPAGALGRLLDLAVDLAGMAASLEPALSRRSAVVMAADHGVAAEGVSAFPSEVTTLMVRAFSRGRAAVNVLAAQAGARVIVVDVGVKGNLTDLYASGHVLDRRIAAGTGNMLRGPAMNRGQALRALEIGLAVATDLAGETDVFVTGEMGIGNTTASSAVAAVLCGVDAERVTGCGTGIDERCRRRKVQAIAGAIARNRPNPADPIDVLAKVGGFEIGALAGLILGAAARRKPVVLDGFISGAAALIACRLSRAAGDFLIASHRSAEPGHAVILEQLGKEPLLDLGLRLGEGTGGLIALHLLEAAARILSRMATLEEVGVAPAAAP